MGNGHERDGYGGYARRDGGNDGAPEYGDSREPYRRDGDDEESRGARARDQRRRRPSQAASPPYQEDQYRPPPPQVPDQYSNGYGGRQDNEAGYYERNASSAALNDDDGYSQKSRSKASLHGYGAQPDTYEIPSLPKSSNNYPSHQQPQFSPSTPRSNGGAGQHASIPPGAQITSNAPQVDMPSFFNEIDEVRDSFRELEQAIVHLDHLHSRNLQGTGSEETQYELEQAANQTRQQTAQLRQRIKALQETTRIRTHGQAEDERLVRKAQIESLRNTCVVILSLACLIDGKRPC